MLDQVRGIQEYLIMNESTLYAVPPGEIPLVIRYSGICQRGLVSVKFTDTIANVRTKVCGLISEITPSHQLSLDGAHLFLDGAHLFLDGAQLSDTKTISECKIAASSELCVVGAGDIPVYIKTRFTEFLIGIKLTDTIQTLKVKISGHKLLRVPQDRQRLVFGQQVVTDGRWISKALRNHHISAGATLYLAIIPDELADSHKTSI